MLPLGDKTQPTFFQQLARWLVSDSRGRVVASAPQTILEDDGHILLRATVRESGFQPSSDSDVDASIVGPAGKRADIKLHPDPVEPGEYRAEWNAEQPGSYVAEIVARRGSSEMGRDVLTFRREDGVAENFHQEQNREVLERLADETGGHYYRPTDIGHLTEDIGYSEAGISARETKELWNMPAVFLVLLLLRGADWLLRRKWGAV